MNEECDYRAQWEKVGLWQVWLKMEELAQVHAGKLSAVVTCAIVGSTLHQSYPRWNTDIG